MEMKTLLNHKSKRQLNARLSSVIGPRNFHSITIIDDTILPS